MVTLSNNMPIPTTEGWQHIEIPIDSSLQNLSAIAGINFYRWGNGPAHAEFWIDNVQIIARSVPIPPPQLALKKAFTGFTMFADSLPNYNRQNLRTGTNANNNVTWVGRPGPVTYSMTVADQPGASHPYFPLHITLVPGLETSSDPDWSAVNCVFLEIINQGDGTAIAGLHYKTNSAGNNAMLFAAGNLGSLTNSSILGTWSLTFNHDTDMTVTAPDGSTLQAALPPEVAALFTAPISVYFGMAVGNDQNLGQSVTFSRLQISGVVNPIDERFTSAALDTNIWSIHPQDGSFQANVVVPTDAKFWFYWGLPDNGFRAQASAAVGNPNAWTDVTLSPIVANGSQKWALVRQANLPSQDIGFLRLFKPTASQLQVLMPGETNAPGTVTGKTGTPDPQVPGVTFNVVVNAVDNQFNIITDVTDTIHLDTSDTGAQPYLPADAAMLRGTITFNNVFFLDYGSWTITATDITNSKIASNTGSPTPVPGP